MTKVLDGAMVLLGGVVVIAAADIVMNGDVFDRVFLGVLASLGALGLVRACRREVDL